MIRVVVFDFDGVIVDSAGIKRKTFIDLFNENELRNAAEKIVFSTSLNSRFDIIRAIFAEAGVRFKEDKVNVYAEAYNRAVQKGILRIGLIEGVYETFVRLHSRCALYVNSSTADDSLGESVHNLRIESFFAGIYGSPATKKENLKKIAERENIRRREMIFVGDSRKDADAATEFGCPFVGIESENSDWGEEVFPVIPRLSLLDKHIVSVQD